MINPYVIPLSWRNMALLMAGGLALWLIPWLVWPWGTPEAARAEGRSRPVFRYIRASQGLDGSAWSPVLMPLPTPDGFSKKADLKALPNKSLVSVLKPKISNPVYMTLSAPARPASAELDFSFLHASAFEADAPAGASPASGVISSAPLIRFEIPEPLRYREFEVPPVQLVLSNGVESSAISAVAVVAIDCNGRVQHVLLEQASGITLVDSAIVRGIRAGRAQPGASNVWGRVRFFYWKNSAVQKE